MKAYCVKCKAKKKIENAEEVFTTKSFCIIKGKCTGCGSKPLVILEKKKKEA